MRILHIVGTISPTAGGPSEVIRTLVRYAPADISSEVATLDDPAAPFLRDLPFAVNALGSSKKSWYVPAFSRWLAANRERFDGVILHGLWEYTGLAALRTLAGRTPYAVFPHGMLDPWFKHAHPGKHRKKSVYWRLIESRVLRRAHRVLFTTTVERDLALQTFSPSRWTSQVTPIGAEAPPVDTNSLLAAFNARCPQLGHFAPGFQSRRFLLFLGRIDPKKGCDLLLQAFTSIAPHNPDLDLVMAGPDPNGWRTQLDSITASTGLAHRVHWPGMLQGDAKWGAFAACEAFVLPSHQENFGIAVVEALASSRPVLISSQINIAPNIAADRAGLVAPDTLEGTKNLLEQWLTTPQNERESMSKRALQTFETRYDIRKNAETILRVFESSGN